MRIAFTVVLMLALTASAERRDYSDYAPIVERQMFGAPPPGFDPLKRPSEVSAKEQRAADKELAKEQERLKNSIRFSVINVTAAGEVMVGFSDLTDAKLPKHYYMKVGDTRDGWLVKEADPVNSSVVIVKDDIEIPLNIGGSTTGGQPIPETQRNAARSAAGPAVYGHSTFSGDAAKGRILPMGAAHTEAESLMARRKTRREDKELARKEREAAEQKLKSDREAMDAKIKAQDDKIAELTEMISSKENSTPEDNGAVNESLKPESEVPPPPPPPEEDGQGEEAPETSEE